MEDDGWEHVGAELVLSCNSSNVEWACRLPAELVAGSDDPKDLEMPAPTVQRLREDQAQRWTLQLLPVNACAR